MLSDSMRVPICSGRRAGWGFRGQREAEWTLQTSLEFMIRVNHSGGHYHLDREVEGRELLLRFRQQAADYVRDLPSNDDLASWLALMQHHGVPTRLLDWTESPHIALYFAIEVEPQGLKTAATEGREKCSALWAIDLDWLEKRGRELLESEGMTPVPDDSNARIQYLNSLLSQRRKPLIVRIGPLKGNDRMVAQKGFFLWKLYEETPFFDQILMSMIIHPEIPNSPVIRMLKVPRGLRLEFLEKLREMDIHRASLFPGLDGFCQSLKLDLEIKVKREEVTAERERVSISAGGGTHG